MRRTRKNTKGEVLPILPKPITALILPEFAILIPEEGMFVPIDGINWLSGKTIIHNGVALGLIGPMIHGRFVPRRVLLYHGPAGMVARFMGFQRLGQYHKAKDVIMHVRIENPPDPSIFNPKWVEIVAPIAGTFYRQPKPGEPHFVEVGDKVEPGTELAIIECNKNMNPFLAEFNGTIRKIITDKDQQIVEAGDILMYIEPRDE